MPGRPIHALVIGIDEYPYLDPDRHLRGAVADAEAISALLRERCETLHIERLINSEANHDAVLAGLDALVAATQPNDEALFYWSGHGSQVRNQEKGEDEEDGWDETLVPYDSGRGNYENHDVIDDEIFQRLQLLTEITDRITFILDSCHSGTAVRTGVRGVQRDPRSGSRSTAGPSAIGRKFEKPRGSSGWLPLSDKYLLLSACKDDQEALELPFRGQIRGAFTWRLCREIKNTTTATTWSEIFNPVVDSLAYSTDGAQIPQIEGARGRRLPWIV